MLSVWHDWLKKKRHQSILTMMHHNRRALPDKQNPVNMFNSHRKGKVKSCNTGISVSCHSSACSNNKAGHYNAPQKIKRLKTIKQRNQLRGQSTNRSIQSHQHCERGSKDKGPCSEYQDCQCSRSVNFCRKEKTVAKSFPSQKTSIITDGRLTSIRGLFSHEVRSVDIERLVKEKKYQEHVEKQEGQATASNSPSPSGIIPRSTPPAVISETSEEGIPACANIQLKSNMLEKTECLQANLEATLPKTVHSGYGKHDSVKTAAKVTDITARPGSPSDQKGMQAAVILSSSESEPVHKSCSTSVKVSLSDHNVILKKKNTHDQKLTNKPTVAMDVQHDFVNTERLDSPARSEVLNSETPQYNPSPEIFTFSSPTLDRERSELGNESQHRKHGFSSKEEAVSRLSARLCHDLGSFPPHRCCPLLTECRKVLLHHLHERHGSQFQHSLHRLHSNLSTEGPLSPHTAEQVWPSSVQKYLDNTQMYLSLKHEDSQQSESIQFPTDNGSQKEPFYEHVIKDAASKRQRKQTQEMYSPQNFVPKLQQPCQDPLSQWNTKAHESLGTKQHANSQMFSLHQTFTGPQTSTPWSSNCADQNLESFFLEPQNQIKLGSGENWRRQSTTLPLLEQWRNDPDLDFLFQDENLKRTHTSLGPLTELRAFSPPHDIESVGERPRFAISSTVSAFYPSKGFCYEPYYRFPHPSNYFNRSVMNLYTQSDVEKWGHGPSLHLTPP